MSPGPAAVLLAALGAAALLAHSWITVAVIAGALLAVSFRAPRKERRLYLAGVLVASLSVFVISPFVESIGVHVLWSGPTIPVLGTLDVTTEELRGAAIQALRLGALMLAFAVYALLLDHDRLVQSAGWARRSVLAVALATRLIPTLERDGRGLVEAMRGRGLQPQGVRGHAALLSPLLAGSLERGLGLAEAMEARGFGRAGRTRVPRPPWGILEWATIVASVGIVVAGAIWL